MSGTNGKLTTHVLDLSKGVPASGMKVQLYRLETKRVGGGGGPAELLRAERLTAELLREAVTNPDGRLDRPLLEEDAFSPGAYELVFDVGSYFRSGGSGEVDIETKSGFLELVPIRFSVMDPKGHYHIPLLVAPGGYSTYRGS